MSDKPTARTHGKASKMAGDAPIRVRMAPSPTGFLHIGTARAALSNFLFARRNGGMFMLRIEDTDAERSKTDFEVELIKGLHWLGLEWDEGPDYVDGQLISKGLFSPYRQSERQPIYKKYVEQLMQEGKAYYCYCTKEELDAQRESMFASGLPPKYSGHCRPEPGKDEATITRGRETKVVRFKTPEIKIKFKDLIRGTVEFNTEILDDMIITRTDGSVLYNLAVVIDDHLMGITHIIRGEDHISNTPKQILFQQALGFAQLLYAHLPLILNQDRTKFSKRKNKASLLEYETAGYLPEAMVNFMALLGWHPRDDREVLSRDELINEFELERVQKSGAVFDQAKLDWLNREHMKKYSVDELATMATPFIEKKFGGLFAIDPTFVKRLVATERERATTLSEFAELGAFFFQLPDYEPQLLIWKETPMREIVSVLDEINITLDKLDDAQFTRDTLAAAVTSLIKAGNRGAVLWPLRVALSGQKASPDPIEIMTVLGKAESMARIEAAIKKLHE